MNWVFSTNISLTHSVVQTYLPSFFCGDGSTGRRGGALLCPTIQAVSICRVIDLCVSHYLLAFDVVHIFSPSHQTHQCLSCFLVTLQTEAADRHADEQRAAVILVARIDDILRSGTDVNVTDERGETALSYVKILLRKGCFRLAHQIASHLLDHGALIDAEDNGQQTLLSHSVAALDGASDLTRLLLNRGADVWHRNATGGDSPFGSFLQAIVRCRCVSGATITADLLGRTMGSRPEAFKALVLRSMLRHGRFIRVLGPVFVQLKSILSPYWKQPQPLRYAAWTVIRRHSSPVKSWAKELQQMGLPPSVLRYLTMED